MDGYLWQQWQGVGEVKGVKLGSKRLQRDVHQASQPGGSIETTSIANIRSDGVSYKVKVLEVQSPTNKIPQAVHSIIVPRPSSGV